MASHHFEKAGVRHSVEVVFASASGGIFGVKKYANSLNQVVQRYGINTQFQHNLVELCPNDKMQHTKYANVFSCGDCSNLPTSKTGAAIRKQAPALVNNLLSISDRLRQLNSCRI